MYPLERAYVAIVHRRWLNKTYYMHTKGMDTTKGEESVEDHLPTSITQGASHLHSDEDMEDKIKLLDPQVQ